MWKPRMYLDVFNLVEVFRRFLLSNMYLGGETCIYIYKIILHVPTPTK